MRAGDADARRQLVMPPTTIYGSGAAPGDATTFIDASTQMSMSSVRTFGDYATDGRSWVQAKIGNTWFDMPHDLSMLTFIGSTGDVTPNERKRNFDWESTGFRAITMYKRTPFGTMRSMSGRDLATSLNHSARYVGQSKTGR